MANYCHNHLYVYGVEQDIENFMKHVKGEYDGEALVLDFNSLVPEPNPRPVQVADDSLGWHVENWGTRSNALSPVVGETWNDDDAVKITFSTAWSPPTPVVLAASERFPSLELSLEYFEGMMGFHGRYTCENGKNTEDLCGPFYGHRSI